MKRDEPVSEKEEGPIPDKSRPLIHSDATNGFSARFLYDVMRRRAPVFAIAFAVLFTVIAVAQYLFVRHGVYKSATEQSQRWADQVSAEIAYRERWDLAAHRQSAEIEAPHVFVVTSSGTTVDTVGYIPGLFWKVSLMDASIFYGPKVLKIPETGEIWEEFAVRIKGGIVALGILNPQDVKAPDQLLKTAATEFGSSIEDASKVRARQIPAQLDYAVIDDAGNLLLDVDWFPLKVDLTAIAQLANSRGLVRRGNESFLVASKSILNSRGEQVGTIIIPKEVTGEEHVIRQHIVFNSIATLASWIAALAVVTLYLGIEDWRSRPLAASLEEALENGESQCVEFKRGLADEHLARAIAAFANTNNGTIFLGIADNCEVVGVDCDTPSKKDHELKRIREITTQSIKPAVSVKVDFLTYHGKVVIRVFVPRGDQPLFFLNREIYVREQTSSMKTTPEQVERILAKFYG
jgi:Putative DNA-binding domain